MTHGERIDLGTDELVFELDPPLAWLTFNRPDARNAMTWAMYEGLMRACDAVDADARVKVFLLRGAGEKAFISGTDISQFTAFTTARHALDYEHEQNRHIGRVEAVTKPTLAVLRGYCTGGGAAIAGACDIRIAAPDVRFGVPIAKTLGNTLSMQNLARIVALLGVARAKDVLLRARFIHADEGRAIGLFSEIVEPERLEARAVEIAHELAALAPLTIRSLKEGIRRIGAQARADDAEDLVLLTYLSEDFQEGVRAFLEKRAPRWRGR